MSRVFALPRGIIASSMTPFDADGRPKLNAIRPHIDWLIDQGVAGISPIGTAGEFFAIEANDRNAGSRCDSTGRREVLATASMNLAETPKCVAHSASAKSKRIRPFRRKGDPSYSKTVAPEARPDISQCHIIHPHVVK
jgi:dihydrodipicolinate synthase/N-acetylneuraminate lyase